MKTLPIGIGCALLLFVLGGCGDTASFFHRSGDGLISEAAASNSGFWANPRGKEYKPPVDGASSGQQ